MGNNRKSLFRWAKIRIRSKLKNCSLDVEHKRTERKTDAQIDGGQI